MKPKVKRLTKIKFKVATKNVKSVKNKSSSKKHGKNNINEKENAIELSNDDKNDDDIKSEEKDDDDDDDNNQIEYNERLTAQ